LIDLARLKPPSAASPPSVTRTLPTSENPPGPIPVPPIAQLPDAAARLHLAQTEPLDDPGAVALQLALITATVAELLDLETALERRIRALEQPWRHRRD
jgi:hypothetical protein